MYKCSSQLSDIDHYSRIIRTICSIYKTINKMVKLKNNIQTLFFISLMMLSTQALRINLLNILLDFKCKTTIKTNITTDGSEVYAGTSLRPIYYRASNGTTTVIAYIVDENRYEEIAHPNAVNARMEIASKLGPNNHEMIVLGIQIFQNDKFDLIGAFLYNIIRPHPNQMSVRIVTMGEQLFNQTYFHAGCPFEKYRENPNICSGALQQYVNMAFPPIRYRSKRLDPIILREVLFYENVKEKRNRYTKETKWPIFVENGVYTPSMNIFLYLNNAKHNFIKRHTNKEYHLLIVSGKDYNRLTSEKRPWYWEMLKFTDEMKKKNEIWFIMGCFNFDWSEIDVVRQIILKHSEIQAGEAYNVSTLGIGMFNTYFQNLNGDDPRELPRTQNERIKEFAWRFTGGTMRPKSIEICDFIASNVTTMQIRLINGRYVPREQFKDYCFSNQHRYAKFAFIVMDTTEMHNENVFSVTQVNEYVEMLKNNSIIVFVIKTDNFKLYDLHIIPEWIQWHRGAVHPNKIAVLGGGSFDTTFKYVSPQYEVTYTLFNVAHTLLHSVKEIRNALVNTAADDKNIIVANIDTSNFRYSRYQMHTINGFYDPVVIPANRMFRTEIETKILFLIMQANKFCKMARTFRDVAPTLITDLRETIASHYPVQQWTVYLVGLDNFGKNDFHLFAEFVKVHTFDTRPLQEFVHTFGDDIYQAVYAWRDTLPFTTADGMPMADAFIEFFGMIDIVSELMD